MSFRVLVVDANLTSRTTLERTLAEAGYLVTGASDYQQGKERLLFAPPDIVVTALKLGWYNGIQLAIAARAENPATSVIVRHDDYDAVLEKEASAAGAAYLSGVAATDCTSLLETIRRILTERRTLGTSPVPRKWPRKPTNLPVRIAGQQAEVVNVSYTGLRLELSGVPDDRFSSLATVYVPQVGSLAVHLVWARGGAGVAGRWWCGAEVSATDPRTVDAWRRLVDSVC